MCTIVYIWNFITAFSFKYIMYFDYIHPTLFFSPLSSFCYSNSSPLDSPFLSIYAYEPVYLHRI